MANRFWVGSGSSTNWSATGNTNWSATSGGSNNASVPTTGDAVIFDANSGTGTSNIDTSLTIATFDASASSAVNLTHTANATVTVTGDVFKWNGTIVYAGLNLQHVWLLTSTTGTSSVPTAITTAGQKLGALTINGPAGYFKLQDDLNVNANTVESILTVTAGTFDANNKNVTVANFGSNNTNTRGIKMGSGLWTITGDS